MAARVSESTELAIPVKNIIGMLIAVAMGTAAYYSSMERITKLEHQLAMLEMDITANTDFRTRWPRGELGSLPADARQDLLIDSLQTATERLDKRLERVDDLQVRVKLVEQKLEDTQK